MSTATHKKTVFHLVGLLLLAAAVHGQPISSAPAGLTREEPPEVVMANDDRIDEATSGQEGGLPPPVVRVVVRSVELEELGVRQADEQVGFFTVLQDERKRQKGRKLANDPVVGPREPIGARRMADLPAHGSIGIDLEEHVPRVALVHQERVGHEESGFVGYIRRSQNRLDRDSQVTRLDAVMQEASLDFIDRADGAGSYALSILVPSGFLSKDTEAVPEELEISITDNGRGFDVEAALERAASGKSLGLLGIQERIATLGGNVDIDSAPGRGTTIRVRMPTEVAA